MFFAPFLGSLVINNNNDFSTFKICTRALMRLTTYNVSLLVHCFDHNTVNLTNYLTISTPCWFSESDLSNDNKNKKIAILLIYSIYITVATLRPFISITFFAGNPTLGLFLYDRPYVYKEVLDFFQHYPFHGNIK